MIKKASYRIISLETPWSPTGEIRPVVPQETQAIVIKPPGGMTTAAVEAPHLLYLMGWYRCVPLGERMLPTPPVKENPLHMLRRW